MGNNITTLYAFRKPPNWDIDNFRPLNNPVKKLLMVHNSTNTAGLPQSNSCPHITASHSTSFDDDQAFNKTKGADANTRVSAITGNACLVRESSPAYPFGINDQRSNIPGDTARFPVDDENFTLIDFDIVSNQADRFPEDNNNSAGPSGLIASADTLAPPRYGACDYADKLGEYISRTLIAKVNQQGKAPLLLRPLAAIASWFGYHGFGQSNCLSCAASVADTLKQGKMYQAFPTQRGGRPSEFATLQNAVNITRLDSVEQLASHLTVSGDLNIVLTIKRPPSLWRRIFHWVDGHACNIIKTGDTLFLVDAQNKKYTLCNISRDDELSNERADVLRAKLAADIRPELTRFVGAVDLADGSLQLYNVGWEKPYPNS